MRVLQNTRLRMAFDDQGRLVSLADSAGTVMIPIDSDAVTPVLEIQVRTDAGEISSLTPQGAPKIEDVREHGRQGLIFTWDLSGDFGDITVRGKVVLPDEATLSAWTVEIENRTDASIWQVAYPRISGLATFSGPGGPDWLACPFLAGTKIPDPVPFVNEHETVIDTWSRSQFGCFDVEGGRADVAYSYPGMWTMQYLAYGHHHSGGIYFAAHDGRALYKRFGMYADGGDGRHAALVMKQYPEDRTARGDDFSSFYPCMVGVYEGDWWGASEIYRRWAMEQFWCAAGPTRERSDIAPFAKELDLWYWNWQFAQHAHPREVVPVIQHIKEQFGCNAAFHWYGSNAEVFDAGNWRVPEIYPCDETIRRTLIEGVKRLHEIGVRCIPYLNTRLWTAETVSFRNADGMRWVTTDEHGKPNDEFQESMFTMCPTAPPWQALIRRINNQMMDEIGMDGAYLDQITGCYSVPCFNPDHDHPAGGHDHWVRGGRQLLQNVQQDIKARSPNHIITSESCIECFLDLLDADLTREISDLVGFVGSRHSLPIPMFNSVYHDYHMTYGTVSTFRDAPGPQDGAGFRLQEALCLVSGCQLMISGVFAGEQHKEEFKPQFEYIERLTRAHAAGRAHFNLGVWKPPLTLDCDRVDVVFDANHEPKRDIPAILSGCFEMDGTLCIALVNHTAEVRKGTATIDPSAYGLHGSQFTIRSVYPQQKTIAEGIAGATTQEILLPASSAAVWTLGTES